VAAFGKRQGKISGLTLILSTKTEYILLSPENDSRVLVSVSNLASFASCVVFFAPGTSSSLAFAWFYSPHGIPTTS
jgi:hypothetical protein